MDEAVPVDRGGGPADRQKHFVIDGEVVVLGVDGVSDFDALHSRKHDDEVQLYVFDMLAGDGEDLRKLPLRIRKTNLSRLLARRVDGIHLAPFEQGEIGPDLFRRACLIGWKAWSRNIARASIAAAGSGTGSKSRIGEHLAYSRRINSRRNDHERSA